MYSEKRSYIPISLTVETCGTDTDIATIVMIPIIIGGISRSRGHLGLFDLLKNPFHTVMTGLAILLGINANESSISVLVII